MTRFWVNAKVFWKSSSEVELLKVQFSVKIPAGSLNSRGAGL